MSSGDRRQFLVGAGCALAWSLSGCVTQRRAAVLLVEQVTGRVRLITGAPGNVIAVATRAGSLLIDSGAAQHAAGVRVALGRERVRKLFNTHHHPDQTGGNALFGEGGAEIHAHAITREWLATDYYVPAEDRWIRALPAAAHPTVTFRDTAAATLGEEHVECGYLLEAHTRGDIFVHLRDSNVLCVGDTASPLRDPSFDWYAGGWLGGRVDALDMLLARADESTRIVPAYGPVMSRTQLQGERDQMLRLFDRLGELFMEGHSAQDMLDAGVLADIGRRFDDPYRFLYDVCKGLWAHYTNFGGRSV